MQTTTHSAAIVPRPQQPAGRRRLDPLRGFDRVIEARIGGDLRLIYGMGVPLLSVTGLIGAFVLAPSYWSLAAVLIVELACLAFVIVKVMAMLDEPDASQPQDRPEFTGK